MSVLFTFLVWFVWNLVQEICTWCSTLVSFAVVVWGKRHFCYVYQLNYIFTRTLKICDFWKQSCFSQVLLLDNKVHCNDVIIWPLITQVWSSVHLVSLRSRPMTSLHTTAQACRRKYAAALLLVAYLCQNQWKSSAGQDCIWNDDCLLWHVTVPTAVFITKFGL